MGLPRSPADRAHEAPALHIGVYIKRRVKDPVAVVTVSAMSDEPHLNVYQGRIYMNQFVFLARHAEVARRRLILRPGLISAVELTAFQFEAAASLLSAGGQASRYLWPSPRQGKTRRRKDLFLWANQRGTLLRALLRVDEGNFRALYNRIVRNAYEHFDEQLDAAFYDGVDRIADYNVYSAPSGPLGAGGRELRRLDPEWGLMMMGEEAVSLQRVRNEISNLAERATWWVRMAHERRLDLRAPIDLADHVLPDEWQPNDPFNRLDTSRFAAFWQSPAPEPS